MAVVSSDCLSDTFRHCTGHKGNHCATQLFDVIMLAADLFEIN